MKRTLDMNMRNVMIVLLALAAAGMEGAFASQVRRSFAYPSACVASLFLGVPPAVTTAGETLLPTAGEAIRVTQKCSAFGFFCLLAAVLMMNVLQRFPKSKRAAGCLLMLPLAYALTLVVNGWRIVCAYYVHRIGGMVLPPNFQAALHQGVGIAVFLSALIVTTAAFERIGCHGTEH